ncbi:hypothetical protein SFR_6336 [Streptomyces sp. FR-008]|nr:hypothetical protein SFR_6336 [Streptomyces sp. FR-008]
MRCVLGARAPRRRVGGRRGTRAVRWGRRCHVIDFRTRVAATHLPGRRCG